jgi:hypothetical protein
MLASTGDFPMLKVPNYQCSFEHARTSRAKFIGKHEIPLFRANTRLQAGASELTVERPVGGLDPAMYWTCFTSVEAEFDRMRLLYGPLRDATYPIIDDFRELVETELEKVASNHGVNPNAPKDVLADPAILDLVKTASSPLPEDASSDVRAAQKADMTEVAISLGRIGMLSIEDIANAQMTKLCEAARISPDLASRLREAARSLVATNAEQDSQKASNLDLGALAGRALGG